MHLIRLLLFEAEGSGKPDLSAYDEPTILEHKRLLIEKDLVKGHAVEVKKMERGQQFPVLLNVRVDRLTWDGHDFVAAARNDTIWNKVLTKTKDKGVEVTLDILKEMLKLAVKQHLGIQP